MKNCLSFIIIFVFPSQVENFFFKFSLPNSKPTTIENIYLAPTHSNSSKVLNNNMNKTFSVNDIYILGYLKIIIYFNDLNNLSSKSIPHSMKIYYKVCCFFG